MSHLVRVGLMGQVGRFRAVDHRVYPRGARVIVRTARGVEVGEVLATAAPSQASPPDGELLRQMSAEDELLASRLERFKLDALRACDEQIRASHLEATLLDAEMLFDGQSLYFYYLGEAHPELESLTATLAETYDAQAQLRRFADVVVEGCGPDCGTENGAGGGCDSGGCQTCAVAAACKSSDTAPKTTPPASDSTEGNLP